MKDFLKPWTDGSILSLKKQYHNNFWSKNIPDVEYKIVVDYIKKLNPQNVLEIGCGNGKNIRALIKNLPDVAFTGVDLSDVGIEYAKKHTKGDFRVCNARKLPFKNNSFDIIFTVHALEQMKYIIKDVAKEIYRVCKKYIILFEQYFVQQNIFGKWHIIRSEYAQGIPFYIEDIGFKIIEFKLLDKNSISKHFLWGKTGVLVGKK